MKKMKITIEAEAGSNVRGIALLIRNALLTVRAATIADIVDEATGEVLVGTMAEADVTIMLRQLPRDAPELADAAATLAQSIVTRYADENQFDPTDANAACDVRDDAVKLAELTLKKRDWKAVCICKRSPDGTGIYPSGACPVHAKTHGGGMAGHDEG